MNILVVDDEKVIREGIDRTISKRFSDHRVLLASNPEEALQLLSTEPIDLVLTDVLMPGMTGLELMDISRKRHPYVKWVVISAYSEFAYAQQAVRLGAKNYLLKPIGKDILIEMISQIGSEIASENEISKDARLMRANLRFLREAIFARWALGLDLAGIDLTPYIASHPHFHLIMIRMESDRVVHLEHFIVENVLSELIDNHGHGFVASIDAKSLLGLVTIKEESDGLGPMLDDLRRHLKRYVKVPFQILHSHRISHFVKVPEEVQRMRKAAATQVYERYATGGDQAIEFALQYIKAHYHEELSLEKAASVVYLNPVYFSQLFKQKTGQGFKEYVIQLRLDQAKEMLHNPALKIADICERIGYQDMRHFSQLFRKRYGMTPSEYRQSSGQLN
jgi:two-component system, response regulator YesN